MQDMESPRGVCERAGKKVIWKGGREGGRGYYFSCNFSWIIEYHLWEVMDSFLDGPKESQKLDMESATQWVLYSVIIISLYL